MKNFLQPGDTVTVPAPSPGVAGGDFIVVGGVYGVCSYDAITGDPVEIKRTGVFTLPKTTSQAWAVGDKLYWDAVAKKFTTAAGTNAPIGVALAAALSADTTGSVLLMNSQVDPVRFGQATTVAASDTIATGLTKVLAAVANLEDVPVIGCDRAQAAIGDQSGAPVAGSILIKTFKPTASGDATPVAATTFGKKVNWVAIGY